MAGKEYTHVRALSGFRLNGEAIVPGQIVAKSAFDSKGDWHTLCNMTPPRAEECDAEKPGKGVQLPGA